MSAIERLLIGTLVLIVAGFGLYLFGAGNGRAEGAATERALWAEREAKWKDDQLALHTAHATEKDLLVKSHQHINKVNSDEHETKLAQVQSDLVAARAESRRLGGLRIPAPASICPGREAGPDAQTTGTGQRDEETASTVALPEQIEDGLWSIVGQADEVTEQLRSCQGWIKANGFYGVQNLK